jgi:hypothetical protein
MEPFIVIAIQRIPGTIERALYEILNAS